VCTDYYGDETLTNNADFTGCSVNEALVSQSLVSLMFDGGAALWGASIAGIGFMCLAVFIHFLRSKEPDRLSNNTLFLTICFSFFPGFSAGSELFIVTAMLTDSSAVGYVTFFFRLLHPFVGAFMLVVLFGSVPFTKHVDKYIKKASTLRDNLDVDYVRANIWLVEMVALTVLADLTMLQLLPWQTAPFFDRSLGYPTMTIMKICIGTKTLQSIVSMICEVWYLSRADSSPKSTHEELIFILNIIICGGTVMTNLWLVCMRRDILRPKDEIVTVETLSGLATTSSSRLSARARARSPAAKRPSNFLDMSVIFGGGMEDEENNFDENGQLKRQTMNPMYEEGQERARSPAAKRPSNFLDMSAIFGGGMEDEENNFDENGQLERQTMNPMYEEGQEGALSVLSVGGDEMNALEFTLSLSAGLEEGAGEAVVLSGENPMHETNRAAAASDASTDDKSPSPPPPPPPHPPSMTDL
jgi:hypothetical protein